MNVIGGYVLRRELGRGGMGVVHLASTPTGGLAAVKVIHPHLARDPAFRRRFDREVTAARSVARFCTAPVLDAGIEEGVAYLVTEYVKGPDLAQAVREQGPLTGGNLEALAVGIATALHAIHGAGVIHRDLKPSNVLLSPLGPRVIDFGIAQLVDNQSLASQAIVGTPAFMAPEQVRADPLTPAADVYAWGGVIAFAGTGRLPFGGGSPSEVLYRIVNEGPNLDGLDERMRAVVERAMAKDPARRPSAQRLLDELVGGRPTPATATQVVERTWSGTAAPRTPAGPVPPDGPTTRDGSAPAAGLYIPGDRNVSGRTAVSGPAVSGPVASDPAVSGMVASGPAVPEARLATARRRWPRVAGVVAGGVALAAVLAGGWAVYTGLGTTALPYRADFADSWAVGASEGGRSERDGGGYVLTANAGWRLWKSAPFSGESAEGIVISSRVRLERGSGEFGVWCHGDSGTGDRYEFAVTGSGEASINKRHGGRSTVLHGPVQVRKSAENRVVAQCVQRGEKVALSMWLNDDLVSEAADTSGPYSPGAVGVYAAPDTAQPVQVRFRTFELRAAKG
ncbi:serine/threonine protein kinase [Microtetraspora sp. AC03309]|uniref:serine/threonine-protein kinase n=1 Tax=Microtetraspora sp. AC03309 TaxID=2779376 RepID=UPI001E53D605|nr:serine/threonine-protein kinase [Microtetraspora sp. AC03309]MCC5575683.1 serine/threonine protein kinase [Microtetraspora sp. AC03309]